LRNKGYPFVNQGIDARFSHFVLLKKLNSYVNYARRKEIIKMEHIVVMILFVHRDINVV